MQGNICNHDGAANALTFLKSIYKRVNICATVNQESAIAQACYDDAATTIERFFNTLDKKEDDRYNKTQCDDYGFWNLIQEVKVWTSRNMIEKSRDLKKFAAATLSAFKLLGETQPATVPAAVSAAIPVPRVKA